MSGGNNICTNSVAINSVQILKMRDLVMSISWKNLLTKS